MDQWEVKAIVVEALNEVRFGHFGVSPTHLRLRRITNRGSFSWIIGFWFKSYCPDIELRHTNIRSRKSIREGLVKRIEEQLPDWKHVVETRTG